MDEGEAVVPSLDAETVVHCGKRAELELDLYASLATMELMSSTHEDEDELVKEYTEERRIERLSKMLANEVRLIAFSGLYIIVYAFLLHLYIRDTMFHVICPYVFLNHLGIELQVSEEAKKLTATCLNEKSDIVARLFRLLREVSHAMQPSNGEVLHKIIKLENVLRELVANYRIEQESIEYVQLNTNLTSRVVFARNVCIILLIFIPKGTSCMALLRAI